MSDQAGPDRRGRPPSGDHARAAACFQAAGLPFPVIPAPLAGRLREHSRWVFATRPLGDSPYMIEAYVTEPARHPVRDYALLAHAGHGVNSYAIHYYLVVDRLRMFIQIGWGGSYMDAEAAARDVHDAFDLADQVCAVARAASPRRVPPGAALTIAVSTFYGSAWWRPGDTPTAFRRDRRYAPREFRQAMVDAVVWLQRGGG